MEEISRDVVIILNSRRQTNVSEVVRFIFNKFHRGINTPAKEIGREEMRVVPMNMEQGSDKPVHRESGKQI
jgi:hypothetical protein